MDLSLAGIFDIVLVSGWKYTEGFTKIVPSVISIMAVILSFLLLSIAIKTSNFYNWIFSSID
ncbi:MAG: hypothetical protein H0V82_00865 [Candidatus Protochlamydia sp.]|nr:hypothetical protein [Candidatus Protochlamydia sp.]